MRLRNRVRRRLYRTFALLRQGYEEERLIFCRKKSFLPIRKPLLFPDFPPLAFAGQFSRVFLRFLSAASCSAAQP